MMPEVEDLNFMIVENHSKEILCQTLHQLDKKGWEVVSMSMAYPTMAVILKKRNNEQTEQASEGSEGERVEGSTEGPAS